jgi:type IV pilus assembly protein PilV
MLEGLIAILIFSIGILGAVGLQATMLKNSADSKYRAEAGYVAQQRLGTMWVDQANLASYVVTNEDVTSWTSLPNGKRTTVLNSCAGSNCVVTVTVTWQQPGNTDVHKVSTVANVSGGT